MKPARLLLQALFVAASIGTAAPALSAALEDRMPAAERPGAIAGQPALAPFAHVLFCRRYPTDCVPGADPDAVVILDAERLAALRRVNIEVNRSIRPRPDAPGPLGDVWTIAPKAGDCDDFAVTKRHRLLGLGFPAAAVRLAIGRVRSGQGHAVAIVRTNKGDLVLDNRNNRLSGWQEADLSLEKLQSGTDPQRWYGKAPLTAFNQ